MKKKFDEIFLDCTKQGTKIKTDEYQTAGRYQIIDQGQKDIAGFSDRETGVFADVPAIVFGDHTRIIKYVDKPFFLGADGVKVLRSKSNDTNYKYLYYALQAVRIPDTGYNRHFKWLKEAEIKLPERSAQEKIAKILDAINGVIEIRQEQLHVLEELVKLRFLEIFGSPVANPKKWKILSFREASFRLSDGPFGSNLKSEHYTDQGVRVIRLGNIGKGVFIDDDKSFVSIEHYEKLKKYTCKAGEIVIATLGDPNLRACIIPDSVKYAINKADCVHYIPKPEILNTEFVCHYINCPETLLLASSMMHGQTRTRISSGQIAKLPIFLPPLELQNQFATFVQKVNNLKFVVQKSIDETQLLFDSLMQKYFS